MSEEVYKKSLFSKSWSASVIWQADASSFSIQPRIGQFNLQFMLYWLQPNPTQNMSVPCLKLRRIKQQNINNKISVHVVNTELKNQSIYHQKQQKINVRSYKKEADMK